MIFVFVTMVSYKNIFIVGYDVLIIILRYVFSVFLTLNVN